MPVCGNYLFFELPKKIVLNPKDGYFAVSVKSERVFCVKLANEACKMTKTWYDRNMKNAFLAQYEAIWMLRWNENRSD